MYANATKQRLAADKVAFGIGVRSARSVEIALLAASSNYHYLFIDLEHSTMDLNTATEIAAAGIAAGVAPIVRVPSVDYADLPRLIDGGAQGIVVPHVDTAEEARRAVEVCLQQPLGRRSTGGPAIQTGWKDIPSSETARLVNEQTMVVVMAETGKAIENIEDIAAVKGVDVISVGTNDLSLSLGVPNDFNHPVIRDVHAKVVAAARRNGKAVRLGGRYDDEDILAAIRRGSRMVTLGIDQVLLTAAMRAKHAVISKLIADDPETANLTEK